MPRLQLGIIAVFLTATNVSAAPAVTREELTRFRQETLGAQLDELLKDRRVALLSCRRRKNLKLDRKSADRISDLLERFPLEPLSEARSKPCGSPPENSIAELTLSIQKIDRAMIPLEERVVELLSLYSDTEKLNRPELCALDLSLAEERRSKAARDLIAPAAHVLVAACATSPYPTRCLKTLPAAIRELDPHCWSVYRPDWNGTRDGNACFAGSKPILSSLGDLSQGDPNALDRDQNDFLNQLIREIDSTPRGSTLAWWDVFEASPLASRPDAKKRFLSLMAFLSSQTTSAAGYIDDFGEEAWKSSLQRGETPRTALLRFDWTKERKDLMRSLLNEAKQKNIRLVMTQETPELNDLNRHDFMAAFLTCHYLGRGERSLAESLPVWMGYAYESKDFASHLLGGSSWKASEAGFKRDTERYRRANSWALEFCSL